MNWPDVVTDAFDLAMDMEPVEGETKESVIQYLLDQTARLAVGRCKGKPELLENCYRAPYTPLGHLSMMQFDGKVETYTLYGPHWCDAVDTLNEHVRKNAKAIFAEFHDQGVEYPDDFLTDIDTDTNS